MNTDLTALLADLDRIGTLDEEQQAACIGRSQWLATASDQDVQRLLAALLDRQPPQGSQQRRLVAQWLGKLVERQQATEAARLPACLLQPVATLYHHLGPELPARHHLLRLLATSGDAAELVLLADLLAEDPPGDVGEAAPALAMLLGRKDADLRPLFPRLLDALAHRNVAAPVLDLANYLTRQRRLPRHPAADRRQQLTQLLGSLVQRLQRLEEQPQPAGQTAAQLSRAVAEGVSLAVSLCDALALIGDPAAVGKLYQALQLSHRRLRTEAAAALAQLGEQPGVQALVELAAEPAARLRVLAYARELGVLDQVPPQFQTPQARAEAELVLWLSQPGQLGIPPSQCQLLDARKLFWPGYQQPIDCYLFRFAYQLGKSQYSNIGIVGPLTHALTADLTGLSPEQIYAAYAGWQAEHPEIQQFDPEYLDPDQRQQQLRLQQRLGEAGFDSVRPALLGKFFDQTALVAVAYRDQTPGAVVTDEADQLYWFPAGDSPRPLGPREAWCIYKGQKLLETFNA